MTIKDSARVSGSLMDVTRLSDISEDECHILFVSARTLYVLANYAENEVNWYGRYYKASYQGGLIDTVEPDDTEALLVDEVARNFRLEVISLNCDLLPVLEAIASSIAEINTTLGAVNTTLGALEGMLELQIDQALFLAELEGINNNLANLNGSIVAIGEGGLPATLFDDIEETLDDIGTVLGIAGAIIG
jgi:hypothetical protein